MDCILSYDIAISNTEQMVSLDTKEITKQDYNKYLSEMYNLANILNDKRLLFDLNKHYTNHDIRSFYQVLLDILLEMECNSKNKETFIKIANILE